MQILLMFHLQTCAPVSAEGIVGAYVNYEISPERISKMAYEYSDCVTPSDSKR